MNNEIEIGKEYYSVRLGKFVTVKFVSGGYAEVVDEDLNHYSTPVSNLRPVEWDAETILKLEG